MPLFQSSVLKKFLAAQLRAYPNPSNGTFTIPLASHQGACRYQVLDASGRMVLSGTATGTPSFPIDLQAQPQGIYLLRLIAESTEAHTLLVKD